MVLEDITCPILPLELRAQERRERDRLLTLVVLIQPEGLVKGETKCLNPECGKLAKSWTMFGRSY